MVSTFKMPKYLLVFPSVLILSWFGGSIPSVRCPLPLFISSIAQSFIILLIWEFFTLAVADGLTANPLKKSRILLNILADLNNVIVWIVSSRPLISKSSNPCTNPSATVLRVPFTIGITVTLIFHPFCSALYQGLGTFLSFCFPSVLPCSQLKRQSPLFGMFSFFGWLFLGLVVYSRLSDTLVPQNYREEIVRFIL